MQFDHVEAQPQAALGGLDEGLLHALQANGVQRHRRMPPGGRIVGQRRGTVGRPGEIGRVGLGQRTAALPRALGGGLAAGMGELHAELHARHPAAHPVDDRLQRRLVLVAVEAETALRDAALALDMRGFEAEQAGARHGEHAVVHLVPGLGAAVDRRVLAHRRNDDAVGQRNAAELDWGEELGGHGIP